jgi:hypothetical protein
MSITSCKYILFCIEQDTLSINNAYRLIKQHICMLSYYFMAASSHCKREEKLRVVGENMTLSSDIGSWRRGSDSVAIDQLGHINN